MIKVYCSSCGMVDVKEDMGFWCSQCDNQIEDSDIISALIDIAVNLNTKINSLEHTIQNIITQEK